MQKTLGGRVYCRNVLFSVAALQQGHLDIDLPRAKHHVFIAYWYICPGCPEPSIALTVQNRGLKYNPLFIAYWYVISAYKQKDVTVYANAQ